MPTTSDRSLLALLEEMDARHASDLFLCEGRAPAARVHGQVIALDHEPISSEAMDALLARALTVGTRMRFEAHGDLDTGLSLDDGRRFRLNLSRQQGKRNVVARAVPIGALEFADLGLPEVVRHFADSARGLVLVTGATGSGKSTTLAALVNHINKNRAAHIVTIEDPIEFVHLDQKARVTQREVGADTESFDVALRHVVRQSPDVILIGEMRDVETMKVALSAALTGHLVLASVHTIDAGQTVQRILSYFPEHLRAQVAMDLSMSLVGIMSQRLLPQVDGAGRVLAAEVLTCTPPIQRLLREMRLDELPDLMRAQQSAGMVTFNASLLALLLAGQISYAQGLAYASNPDEFALAAKGMTTGVATFAGTGGGGLSAGLDMQGLLQQVVDQGASDLHLAVDRPPILRVAGKLRPLGERVLTDADMRTLLFSILSARQRGIFEIEREIDFALALDTGQRFRVNAYYQKGRMAAALRAIPSDVPDAERLKLPPIVLELGLRPQGLLLVVGPTGAGKSTTLACLVDRINRTRACRIITIEDPVEYAHISHKATVDQREVFADTQSFAAALKYILRQDPDVIMVGEMRDLETVSAVLTAAETGHLVFATLHSNDATQAIDRIVDVFPSHQQSQARSQLSSALLGVASQRLLPRKGHPHQRVPVFEVMVATPAIRTLIRDNKMHQAHSLMETSRRDGNVTMDQALRSAYEQGAITYESGVRYARNPASLGPPPGGRAAAPPPAEGPPEPTGAPQAPPRERLPRAQPGEGTEGSSHEIDASGKKRFPWSR